MAIQNNLMAEFQQLLDEKDREIEALRATIESLRATLKKKWYDYRTFFVTNSKPKKGFVRT